MRIKLFMSYINKCSSLVPQVRLNKLLKGSDVVAASDYGK